MKTLSSEIFLGLCFIATGCLMCAWMIAPAFSILWCALWIVLALVIEVVTYTKIRERKRLDEEISELYVLASKQHVKIRTLTDLFEVADMTLESGIWGRTDCKPKSPCQSISIYLQEVDEFLHWLETSGIFTEYSAKLAAELATLERESSEKTRQLFALRSVIRASTDEDERARLTEQRNEIKRTREPVSKRLVTIQTLLQRLRKFHVQKRVTFRHSKPVSSFKERTQQHNDSSGAQENLELQTA